MTDDYLQRFGGVARLYGRAGLERLHAAHVAVIGVGGVGSWTIEALARSGIGALTLIDLDDVCITNVNRQLPALDGSIGRPKVEALADRVRAINPGCHVAAVAEFFTASSAERILGATQKSECGMKSSEETLGERQMSECGTQNSSSFIIPRSDFSFVVDATDKLANKCLILTECLARKIPVLTLGGAGGKRDGTAVRVRDLAHTEQDELLRQVRRKLRREFAFPGGEHGAAPSHQSPFGIPAVFSPEKPVFPWADGTCSAEPEPGSSLTLDCATGFGTACHVTAAFGLAAAGEVLRQLTA